MKNLIALAAASFITTTAMADGVQLPDTSTYVAEITYRTSQGAPDHTVGPAIPTSTQEQLGTECELSFHPFNDSRTNGTVDIHCGDGIEASMTWDYISGLQAISFEMDGEMPYAIAGGNCHWSSLEVGETVSDPCWLTSATGTPIQVRRAN